MKKIIFILFLFISLSFLSACKGGDTDESDKVTPATGGDTSAVDTEPAVGATTVTEEATETNETTDANEAAETTEETIKKPKLPKMPSATEETTETTGTDTQVDEKSPEDVEPQVKSILDDIYKEEGSSGTTAETNP